MSSQLSGFPGTQCACSNDMHAHAGTGTAQGRAPMLGKHARPAALAAWHGFKLPGTKWTHAQYCVHRATRSQCPAVLGQHAALHVTCMHACFATWRVSSSAWTDHTCPCLTPKGGGPADGIISRLCGVTHARRLPAATERARRTLAKAGGETDPAAAVAVDAATPALPLAQHEVARRRSAAPR